MHFEDSLWDDSDPTYAPCLKHRKDRGTYFWRPPKKYLDAGYSIKTYRLEGSTDDGLDLERARHCRAFTREMVIWYEGETEGRQPGTWGWLIARFKTDDISPIHDVSPSTRADYLKVLGKIEDAIGEVLIRETDYGRIMNWRKTMLDRTVKGKPAPRSDHYIKKWFTHWGFVNSYGIKIGAKYGLMQDCLRLKSIRSEMRLPNGAKRSVICTRDQVNAIVARADELGLWQLSLSVLLRFEFMLRGVTVYGEWEPAEGGEGGIIYNTKSRTLRWVKGMTWEMFNADVTSFETVISKTARSLPEPYLFELTNTPEIRKRLLAIPEEQRVGPVIKMADGLPPRSDLMTKQFKRIVRDLELPDELRISDNRAGGITEAKTLVDPYELRDAAQHTQITTTDRYVRDRSSSANKVVRIRSGK